VSNQAEAEAIRAELGTLDSELGQIGGERGQSLLTGQQARIATGLMGDIDTLRRSQRDQVCCGCPTVCLGHSRSPRSRSSTTTTVRILNTKRLRAALNLSATTHAPTAGVLHETLSGHGRAGEWADWIDDTIVLMSAMTTDHG
jgi:hypothetical protein